jgi:hypothetical protein
MFSTGNTHNSVTIAVVPARAQAFPEIIEPLGSVSQPDEHGRFRTTICESLVI